MKTTQMSISWKMDKQMWYICKMEYYLALKRMKYWYLMHIVSLDSWFCPMDLCVYYFPTQDIPRF